MDGNETLSEKRDKADESWADFVRKGKYFYGDHLTAPAFSQLLGCFRGFMSQYVQFCEV